MRCGSEPLSPFIGGYVYGAIVPVDVVGWWATFTIGMGGVGGLLLLWMGGGGWLLLLFMGHIGGL